MSRKFGIEIECYIPSTLSHHELANKLRDAGINALSGFRLSPNNSHWKVTSDGSLNSGPTGYDGVEVVSPPLPFNEESFEQIRKVCDTLNVNNAKIRKSCGLHVHIGAHGLTLSQAIALFKRYAKHEMEIDAFMPTSRRGSVGAYCRSIVGMVRENVTEIHQIIVDRYYKLNPKSYVKFGTIEFRHHSGTTDARKIINWVKFCMQFFNQTLAIPVASDSHVELNVPSHVRSNRFFQMMPPMEFYRRTRSSNHRKINNMIKLLEHALVAGRDAVIHGSIKDYMESRTSAAYAREISGYFHTLFGVNYRWSTTQERTDLLTALLWIKKVASPRHGYNQTYVGRATGQIANINDLTLFSGVDPDVVSFYEERAMELAAA